VGKECLLFGCGALLAFLEETGHQLPHCRPNLIERTDSLYNGRGMADGRFNQVLLPFGDPLSGLPTHESKVFLGHLDVGYARFDKRACVRSVPGSSVNRKEST
jgi:hypothetical protein